jgi:hypothetical protein
MGKHKSLEFKKVLSNILESSVFFDNGLGVVVLSYDNGEYECIPVIGSESSYKLIETFDDTVFLTLETIIAKSIEEVYSYLELVESKC